MGDPNAKIIEGPCCVVDTILKHCEVENIIDLVGKSNYSSTVFDDSILKLVPESQKVIRNIIKSPR